MSFEQVSPRQRGMALVVSLVLLLSMTLLALAAMQNTSLEERMAGSVRSENIALQAAESALRMGEACIELAPSRPEAKALGTASSIDDPVADNASCDVWVKANNNPLAGPYNIGGLVKGKNWWEQWTAANWATYAESVGTSLVFVAAKAASGTTPAVAEAALDATRQPRFVVEEFGLQSESLVRGQPQDTASQAVRYVVTARGVDAGGRGEVLLQSRILRRF
jgi:Tfp pilus assembly protein PilX